MSTSPADQHEAPSLGSEWVANRAPAISFPCPSCDHVNPEGSKFCNRCGMPVDFRECAFCQAINDGAAKLCYKCGNSLLMTPPLVSASEALPEQIPEASMFVAVEAGPATVTVRRRRTGMAFAVVGVCLAALAIPTYIAYQDREPMRPAAPETPAETQTVLETNATPPATATEAPVPATELRPDEGRASEAPPPPSTTSGTGAAPPGPKAVPKKKANSRQSAAKSKRNKEAGTSPKN